MNEQIRSEKRFYCNSVGIEVTNIDLKYYI